MNGATGAERLVRREHTRIKLSGAKRLRTRKKLLGAKRLTTRTRKKLSGTKRQRLRTRKKLSDRLEIILRETPGNAGWSNEVTTKYRVNII